IFPPPIAAIATRATMMMYSVNPCPLRFEALSLVIILVFLLCLGSCRPGGARVVPVFFRERRAEYPEEIREDVEKEVRSRGGTDSEGVRISDRWFDDRSYYGMRIPYFFSFSNRVDLAIPSSRAVRVLFHFCRVNSVSRLFLSDCSHRDRDCSETFSAGKGAAGTRKEKSRGPESSGTARFARDATSARKYIAIGRISSRLSRKGGTESVMVLIRKYRSSRKFLSDTSVLRFRFVPAMTRTSTGIVSFPPTRLISFCSRTRRRLGWGRRGRSPISSRKVAPPCATL